MSDQQFPNALHDAAAAMRAAYRVRYVKTTPKQAATAMNDLSAVPAALREIARALSQRAGEVAGRGSNPGATSHQRQAAVELAHRCDRLFNAVRVTSQALNGVVDALYAVEAEFQGTDTEL